MNRHSRHRLRLAVGVIVNLAGVGALLSLLA